MGDPVEMAKYGQTTRTRLDHLARGPSIVGGLNQVDVERLWEVVQAAEGLDTTINPIHARQRLRKAVEALREDNRG